MNKQSTRSRLLFAVLGITVTFGLLSAGYSAHKTTSGKLENYMPTPPRSGGAAANGLGDRTGSPINGAGSSCANCHGGGSYSPTMTINVFDSGMNAVTSYIPGDTYTIEYIVAAGSGSPAGYGMQGVALNSSNGSTGNMTSAITVNSQIVSSGGVNYFEHMGTQAAGNFQVTWTAPSAGTGAVSLYARGLALNGNGGTSGDEATASQLLSLTEVVPTTINYPGTPYCANATNQTPVQTGETGGTFSAPVGLDIDVNSGVIDVSNSTEGTYQVDYVYSQGTTSFSVTINPTYNVSSAATICSNETLTFGSQTLDLNDGGLNTEVFQASNGCDSTVNLTLTVLPALTGTETVTICETGSYLFDGQLLDASNAGLNTATFQSANGCDSVVNLTLIVETIDGQITQTNEQLTATQTGATYQWVDCNNGNAPISGETGQTFAPAVSGSYAVEITVGPCMELSACEDVTVTIGIDENEMSLISIAPSPVGDVLHIQNFSELQQVDAMSIVDAFGKQILAVSWLDSKIDVAHIPSGVYFLIVDHNSGQEVIKFVKQ